MIVYATHSAFLQNNIIVGFIPEGVGAFATPVRNRMVTPVDLSDHELQALIQHELTHIFEYDILFADKLGRTIRARPPLWIMEGLASFLAEDEDSFDQMEQTPNDEDDYYQTTYSASYRSNAGG